MRTSLIFRARGRCEPKSIDLGGISMQNQRGLTLVELVVTLSLLSVLLASAMPSFRDFTERQQAVGLNNRLMAHLALARTQAVLQRAVTVVCPSNLGGDQCRSGGDWSEQWLVFVDRNGDLQRGEDEPIISQESADLPAGWQLLSSAYRPRVRYQPSGLSHGSNMTLRLCDGSRLHSSIVVNNAGRPRLDRQPKGSCE